MLTNFFIMPKMKKVVHFGPKMITVRLFAKSVYQVFLKLLLMTGINKGVKVTVLNCDFEGKFIFYTKWGKWFNC